MKTLAVTYLPRGERSRTKRLFDCFRENCPGEINHLDLTEDVPDFFLVDNLIAYYRRDYAGEKISAKEEALLEKMDKTAGMLADIDTLVLAFPMHNFSFPGIVKAFFDSVMLKGKTWDVDENGYKGLLAGKRALVLYSSGGVYVGETSSYNCLEPLANADLGLMGFNPVKIISAQGMNLFPEKQDDIINGTKNKIIKLINEWY